MEFDFWWWKIELQYEHFFWESVYWSGSLQWTMSVCSNWGFGQFGHFREKLKYEKYNYTNIPTRDKVWAWVHIFWCQVSIAMCVTLSNSAAPAIIRVADGIPDFFNADSTQPGRWPTVSPPPPAGLWSDSSKVEESEIGFFLLGDKKPAEEYPKIEIFQKKMELFKYYTITNRMYKSFSLQQRICTCGGLTTIFCKNVQTLITEWKTSQHEQSLTTVASVVVWVRPREEVIVQVPVVEVTP